MKKLASLFRLDFLPTSVDAGLLLIRLWYGLSLLCLHGWGKLSGFKGMANSFMDPLKIGSRNSLILALVGEVLCPILIILGLFTRFGALGSMINVIVAFTMIHHFRLTGSGNGELAYLYMGAFAVILIAGPGRFALDGKKSGAKRPKPARD